MEKLEEQKKGKGGKKGNLQSNEKRLDEAKKGKRNVADKRLQKLIFWSYEIIS